MKSEGNSNVTGHCWLMTATACEHSVIEAKVKVMWNCSIVVICNWFVSILCPLLSLLCHITNHINTGPMANSFKCSLLDKFLSVLEHFFRRCKINHIQILYSLSLKTKHYNNRKYNNTCSNNNIITLHFFYNNFICLNNKIIIIII